MLHTAHSAADASCAHFPAKASPQSPVVAIAHDGYDAKRLVKRIIMAALLGSQALRLAEARTVSIAVTRDPRELFGGQSTGLLHPHTAAVVSNTMRALLDTPLAAETSYSAQPQLGVPGFNYISEAGADELYRDGRPSLDDLRQGNIGDCYFDAALASLVASNADFLVRSVRQKGKGDNGHNQYQVRFFYQGKEEWVYVDDSLPEDTHGTRLGNQQAQDTQGGETKNIIWFALWEKAFVKFTDVHPDVMGKGVQGYADIVGGNGMEALQAITGLAATQVDVASSHSPQDLLTHLAVVDNHRGNAVFAFRPAADLPKLPGWNAAAKTVNFPDGTTVKDAGGGQLLLTDSAGQAVTIVDGHMYTVLTVDGSARVQLRNPWGDNPGSADPNLWVSAALMRNAGLYGVTCGPTPRPHHGWSAGAIGGTIGGALGAVLILTGIGWLVAYKKEWCCYA